MITVNQVVIKLAPLLLEGSGLVVPVSQLWAFCHMIDVVCTLCLGNNINHDWLLVLVVLLTIDYDIGIGCIIDYCYWYWLSHY